MNKKLINFFYQRRAGAIQELRYSAIEINYYVFRLKCLVPESLRPVRNPVSPVIVHKLILQDLLRSDQSHGRMLQLLPEKIGRDF